MGVIVNQREMPSEFNNAGELAALFDGTTDGFGSGIIDSEHGGILHTPSKESALNRLHARANPYRCDVGSFTSLADHAQRRSVRDRRTSRLEMTKAPPPRKVTGLSCGRYTAFGPADETG